MNNTKHLDRKYKAILVDFDGVLRQWPDSDISIESKYGLLPGSIREAAFEPFLLNQAIRGTITDEKWRAQIADNLQKAQPDSDVASAIKEWSAGTGKINAEVLSLLTSCKPNSEILLLTNATSRLSEDLEISGLDNWFSEVLNSSDLGSVKPEPEIFQAAVEACNCKLDEIVYIDDSQPNTQAATNAGIFSHHYTDLNSCKQFLSKIGLPGE